MKTGGDHFVMFHPGSGDKQRVWQPRVAIRKPVFEPRKILAFCPLIKVEQTTRKRLQNSLDMGVAVTCTQVFVNSKERIRPRSRARKNGSRTQRRWKQLSRQIPTAGIARPRHHRTECPQ